MKKSKEKNKAEKNQKSKNIIPTKNKIDTDINESLLNAVSTSIIKFGLSDSIIGSRYTKTSMIKQLPTNINLGWLSKLTNIDSSIVTVNVTPISTGAFMDSLTAKLINSSGDLDSNNPLKRKEAKLIESSGDRIMDGILKNNESLVDVSILISANGQDKKELDTNYKRISNSSRAIKANLMIPAGVQEDAHKMLSPIFDKSALIENMARQTMPMSTFIGGHPFSSSSMLDKTGNFIGLTPENQLILIDIWNRQNHNNSNVLIIGTSGAGKSATAKDVILSEYGRGAKLIVLDPENEYSTLTKPDGTRVEVINCGGSEFGRLNPLQLRPVPKSLTDENDSTEPEEVDRGLMDKATHLKFVQTFFKMYIPTLTGSHLVVLEECLIETYNRFNIFWETDTSEFRNEDFPIISDLYKVITELSDKNTDEVKHPIFSDLLILLQSVYKGSDQFIWNGHTTLSPESDFVVLNTSALNNAPEEVKKAQYYNILTWTWDALSNNRQEKVMVVADEAYMMLDPEVPQTAIFMRDFMKRARKYEGSFCVITQKTEDFLNEKIKLYGQDLLDIPDIKILLGTTGDNLKNISTLFNLTEKEKLILGNVDKGRSIILSGKKRFEVQILLKHAELHGKGGGR